MKAKRIALFLFVLFSVAEAIASQWPMSASMHEMLRITLLLMSAGAIFAWFRADAIGRAYRRSSFLNVAVFGLAGLALPYYFIRSRGWKRGGMAVLASIGILLATGVFAEICTMLIEPLR